MVCQSSGVKLPEDIYRPTFAFGIFVRKSSHNLSDLRVETGRLELRQLSL